MKQSTRRLLTYGSNASLVILIVVAVHVMVYILADNNRVRWDFSEGASNTLDPDTVSKLRQLDSDGQTVTITAFSAQSGKDDAYIKNRSVQDLLKEINFQSQVIEYRWVDYDRDRLTAERLGVTDYGRIVIQRGSDRVDIKDREMFRRTGKGAQRSLQFLGEQAIARAFAQILTDTRKVVYVLTNHGELAIDNIGPDGMSDLAAALDQERYDVEPLNLLTTDRDGELPQVPDDAAAVFVVRPKSVFTDAENDILLSYLGRGGSLLFALDVGLPVPDLVRRVGVNVPEGIAYSKKAINPYWDRPVLVLERSEITQELLDDGIAPIFASAAPLLTPDDGSTEIRHTPLVKTAKPGWIERGGVFEEGKPTYEPTIDAEGPATVGTMATVFPGRGLVRATKQEARVVVLGDGEAFTNALMSEGPGNRAFAINITHFLANQDVRLQYGGGRVSQVRKLPITPEELGTIRLVSLGLMPLLVLIAGVLTWRSRQGR
ncbi:MAG: DUF4350 domain-containing protein [Myxococcota bacterium]